MSKKIADIQDYEDCILLEETYTVERIVAKKKFKGKLKYLVKWENYPEEQNTWEPIENLANVRDLIRNFEEEEEKKKLIEMHSKKTPQMASSVIENSNTDKMIIDDYEIIEEPSEININQISQSTPLVSNNIKPNTKTQKEGNISVDIPLKIIGAKIKSDDPFELNCMIEWKSANGVRPLNSYVSSLILKKLHPDLLINYYEENVKYNKTK